MRKVILGMMLAVSVAFVGAPPVAASALGAGAPGAPAIETLMHKAGEGGGYCSRLRRACENKEERGEEGQGNCRRYRNECGGGVSRCERLRRACENKEERGQEGQGNCRRYRDECGGQRD